MICNCTEHYSTCLQYSKIQEKHAQIHYILKNLAELLESEISSCLMGRQLELFDHYFRMEPQAHFVNDLAFVCRLLELIPGKMYENEVFKEYYEKYLYLSGLPPLMLQSSELLRCTTDLEEFFSVLGGLLFYLKDESHIHILLESLISLLSSPVKWPSCFMPLNRLQKAAVSSRLPQIVGRFLLFASGEIYEKILRICTILAETSTSACHRMIEEGAVDSLLIQLEPTWRSRPIGTPPPSPTKDSELCHYEEFSTLIWLLLKSLKGSNLDEIINRLPTLSRLAFWNLRYALLYFFNKNKYKVDRNNILAITLKILAFFPKTEFLNSGMALDIVQLNSIVEVDSLPNTDWSGLQITPCAEDFIFVRLLLMFLPLFNKTEYYGGMQYLRDSNIIQLKLKMLTQTQSVKWHKEHLEKLICIVGSTLAEIVADVVDVFLANRGAKTMMDLVDKTYSIEVILTMLRSILIMGRIEKVKAQMIIHRMLDAKVTYSLIDFCDHIMSKESMDFKYQLALAYIFALLEKLYKRKTTLSNKRIINLSINLLKRIRKPNERDYTILPILPIMILSSLWNILLCDEENLNQFLKDEGVYITLDLAETGVWPLKIISLGLLCEICQEPVAVPFFITWRSKRNQKIMPFLLALFREENKMIGVKQNSDGLILDVEYPVMGIEQYKSVCNPQNTLESCPAISDLIGSCRPKVYGILTLLTIRHEEEVRMADEIYKMWNEELSLKDMLTKVVAENFFALKIVEVWNELELHFERYGVRPLADDYEMLSIILTRARRWGIYLQGKQRDILRTNCEKEEIKENLLYIDLRESRIGDTLSACRELDFIARCTKDVYRIKAKKKTNTKLLQNQTKNTDPDILYHTTFMYDIMVNVSKTIKLALKTIYNQYLFVRWDYQLSVTSLVLVTHKLSDE
ncbi:hypothetical protein WA026_000803 [Henosepilachna vigintioctopunctata]|uniref:Cilia- and flagella-associated protein 69 ARM repeats domain-containing protein n=1 Tax=Henosepilachna vigintioctopunctata TaxID=420089 RepID=A0AAW1V7I4_9CUCU